jgi:hypothetical protein
MIEALDQAGAKIEDVVHINAHATSTPVGDIAEYTALKRVFGDHLDRICVSATKSSTGHLLGGAGAIEAIFTVLALGPTLIWGADSRFSYFFPHALVESASSQPITWLPYGDLTAVPGLSALRTPNRFAMILPVLGVAALAVLANEFLKSKPEKRIRLLALSSIVLLMLPNFRNSNYWYNTSFNESVLQW